MPQEPSYLKFELPGPPVQISSGEKLEIGYEVILVDGKIVKHRIVKVQNVKYNHDD